MSPTACCCSRALFHSSSLIGTLAICMDRSISWRVASLMERADLGCRSAYVDSDAAASEDWLTFCERLFIKGLRNA